MHNTNDSDALSQALAEPSRRAILNHLRFGSQSVSALVAATKLKQPNVSNHLAKMKSQGIVGAERSGRSVHYFLATPYAEVLLRTHEFVANANLHSASSLADIPPTSAEDVLLSTSTSEGHSPSVGGVPTAGRQELSMNADRARGDKLRFNKESKKENKTVGSDILKAAPVEAGSETPPTVVEWKPAQHDTEARIALWRSRYLDSLLRGDEHSANALVNVMLAENGALETIYTQVFAPSLNLIGDMWARGETDEAHEHHASAITERMMARVAHFRTPVVHARYTALLGCVVDNWHSFGLRMLADGLREIGWDTIFLGANVPVESFIRMAEVKRPDLVVISCAMEAHLLAARELIVSLDILRNAPGRHDFQIVVGGNGLTVNRELLMELPIDFTAEDLSHFLSIVRSRFPAPSPSLRSA